MYRVTVDTRQHFTDTLTPHSTCDQSRDVPSYTTITGFTRCVLRARREGRLSANCGRTVTVTRYTFWLQLSSHKQHPPHPSGRLCYDKHHVWAVTVAVTIPHKLPCGLMGGFIRKNFRINPLQGSLVGKFAFYRHLSRKKVRLNRCSAALDKKGEHHAGPHR